jgi:hypothetical protein
MICYASCRMRQFDQRCVQSFIDQVLHHHRATTTSARPGGAAELGAGVVFRRHQVHAILTVRQRPHFGRHAQWEEFTIMNPKILLSCFLLLVASPLFAREKSDVLVMRNGDRLTCEIKSLDSDTLSISLDYAAGAVSINWGKVDHIESKQLFLVKTQDGLVYSGSLSTVASLGARPTKIELLEASTRKLELDKTHIIHIEETDLSFWRRFNGEIGLSSIYNKGNQSAQYNLNADATYPRERWSASVSYSSSFSSSKGSSAVTRNETQANAQRLLRWNNWYYAGLADFLQSSESGIQLQSTFGGGIGRYLKNTNNTMISVYSGLAWQNIAYHQQVMPATNQQVTAALIVGEMKLFRFDKTNLNLTATVLPALSKSGRVHTNLNVGYDIELWRKFNWNFSFYGNWDSQPPPGLSGSDYGASSGISRKFGNR